MIWFVVSHLFLCFSSIEMANKQLVGSINNTWLWVKTMFTSSTAQGGGGSFKNMKPIGEVGCCESRMAERIH